MSVLPPHRDSDLITQVSRSAMATEFVVMLPAAHSAAVEQAVAALEMLDEIERQLTIYRPESEISRVNREAALKPVPVSESTFALIESAIQWSIQTEGRFDITAGPLVRVWGFTERKGRKPTREEVQAALAVVGFDKLVLDRASRSIAFAVPGMSINLGGIGKGYALDRVAKRLVEQGIVNFLIHGGQSSVLAMGNQSADVDRGWAVGIAHPTRPNHRLAGIWLRNAALGTSGSGNQFFHHRGKRFGHVIDPRSGYPTTDLISLSICTANAIDADAAGTGYFLAGSAGLAGKVLADRRRPEPAVDGHEIRQRETGLASSVDDGNDSVIDYPMIAVRPGNRRDEFITQATGDWDWVEPPCDSVSRQDQRSPLDSS